MKFKKANSGTVEIHEDYRKNILFGIYDFMDQKHLLQTVTIPPHTKQREHFHSVQTEVFYILRGECLIVVNGREYLSKQGDAIICEPHDVHYLWNKTDKEFELVVFKINYPGNTDTQWK